MANSRVAIPVYAFLAFVSFCGVWAANFAMIVQNLQERGFRWLLSTR